MPNLSRICKILALILQETWQESCNTSWQFLVWTALHDLAKILQESCSTSWQFLVWTALHDLAKILQESCNTSWQFLVWTALHDLAKILQETWQDLCKMSWKFLVLHYLAKILHETSVADPVGFDEFRSLFSSVETLYHITSSVVLPWLNIGPISIRCSF